MFDGDVKGAVRNIRIAQTAKGAPMAAFDIERALETKYGPRVEVYAVSAFGHLVENVKALREGDEVSARCRVTVWKNKNGYWNQGLNLESVTVIKNVQCPMLNVQVT